MPTSHSIVSTPSTHALLLRALTSAGLVAVVASLGCGCVSQVPLRTSSAERVTMDQAHLEVAADAGAVERFVQAIAEHEGLKLANKIPVPRGGTVWIFRADRANLLSVRGGGGVLVAESHGIGTWLAVRVTPASATTRIALLAKPTVDGVEVCSNADRDFADVEYWCKDTLVRDDFQQRHLLDGRVEAETVVRVSEQLRQGLRGEAGAAGARSPATSL